MARSSGSEDAEYDDENDYDCEDDYTDEDDYRVDQRQRRQRVNNGDSIYEDPRMTMAQSAHQHHQHHQQQANSSSSSSPWADVLFMIGFFPIAVNAATYALVVALNHLADSVWSEEI